MTQLSVNGVAIPEAAIAAEMQNHPASSADDAWHEAARALAVRELLLQEARRQGLETEAADAGDGRERTAEEGLIERLLEREVRVPEADEAACRRYYESNRQRFRTPDLFEASHILLAASVDDKAAHAAACGEAEELIAGLQRQPDTFAALAKARSACPSASTGGSLGQVSKGQTVPEFETFLFALESGQLCPVPVKTRYGAHVLRLDRRIEGRQLPFEMVHERIAEYLGEAVWRRANAQYLKILAGSADLQGVDLDAGASPLVQ
ncbi:peptidylprolyl isomerase [Thalassobaculum sp.]|uniref:peptidylprolyl isomerase n=1 Tax=Thalassobaculum sp. TaxID=2022740 RepID=UPI0032EE6B09